MDAHTHTETHTHTRTHTEGPAVSRPRTSVSAKHTLGAVVCLCVCTPQTYVQSPDEDAVFEAAIEAGADDVAPSTDDNENVIHKVSRGPANSVLARAKAQQWAQQGLTRMACVYAGPLSTQRCEAQHCRVTVQYEPSHVVGTHSGDSEVCSVRTCPFAQVFTSVEAYVTAKAALAGAGFPINEEESGLVYKAQTPVEVGSVALVQWAAALRVSLHRSGSGQGSGLGPTRARQLVAASCV